MSIRNYEKKYLEHQTLGQRTTSLLSHRPSNPAYHIEDCRISAFFTALGCCHKSLFAAHQSLLSGSFMILKKSISQLFSGDGGVPPVPKVTNTMLLFFSPQDHYEAKSFVDLFCQFTLKKIRYNKGLGPVVILERKQQQHHIRDFW